MHCDLHLDPPRTAGNLLTLSGFLHLPHRDPLELRFELPTTHAHAVTTRADPFLIGFLFPLMQAGASVTIYAPVSASLLPNLQKFIRQWRQWFPHLYRPVTFHTPHLVDNSQISLPQKSILLFSTGIDSTFTLRRHHHQLHEKSQPIAAALLLNNFDINPTDQRAATKFHQLHTRALAALAPTGIPLIPVNSNFRSLPTHWVHSHGAHLISSLHLLSGTYTGGLIANSISNRYLATPWGSHPLTDPLLSSTNFSITDDGADHIRLEKIKFLSQFPNIFDNLGVCYENPASVDNCCRCEKCVITILAFRMANVPLPPVFPHNPTDAEIARLHLDPNVWAESWQDIRRDIHRCQVQNTSWARAVHRNFRRHRPKWFLQNLKRSLFPLRNLSRTLFRGSPLSLRQRALQSLTAKPEQPPKIPLTAPIKVGNNILDAQGLIFDSGGVYFGGRAKSESNCRSLRNSPLQKIPLIFVLD